MNELQYLINICFDIQVGTQTLSIQSETIGIYRTYDDCTRARAYAWSKGQWREGQFETEIAVEQPPGWSEMGDNVEQVLLELELKSIADIALSNAKPCVSSLPFTTHTHWKWYYSEHR